MDQSETLAQKDVRLADIYKRVLAGAGTNRAVLVAAQSKWLIKRDRECLERPSPEEEQINCLRASYDKRIDELKPAQPGVAESLALCRGLLDRYRAILKANPQAQYQPGPKAEGILGVLKADAAALFEIENNTISLRSSTNDKAPTATAYVSKYFHPDEQLKKTLAPDEDGTDSLSQSDAVWLTRMPHSDVYAISTLNGTMRCENAEVLFKNTSKAASLVDLPSHVAEGECTAPQFAAIANRPVLIAGGFEGNASPKTYDLTEGYNFSLWRDGWLPACNISLIYAPKLGYSGQPGQGYQLTDGDGNNESCTQDDTACISLREDVLSLMKRYQLDPATMPRQLFDELDTGQRDDFKDLKDLSDKQSASQSDDAYRTGSFVSLPIDMPLDDAIPLENKPVALPLIHDGKLMLVLAGHPLTTGSRDLPDYSVWVKQRDGQGVKLLSGFTITLTFGVLEKASVSLH
ncbi:lysozyme inhibitor LprI family protein [Phyllobacterium myrsinacearum]|uniref:Lysozyme inhibitor LprI-like N-terminal domain-containing protein n=1 Tax=Phyllobacterium myrsinacearum TaxID=28101 RepID=A0A839EH66_9HYPH|nr:uncharacterized protein [Phyllobacterium myrsinacearum]